MENVAQYYTVPFFLPGAKGVVNQGGAYLDLGTQEIIDGHLSDQVQCVRSVEQQIIVQGYLDSQKGYQDIAEELSGEQWGNDEYRQELLIAAEGICVMAELSAKLAGYEIECVTDTHEWLERYSESWMRKNKASELYRIKEMFEYYYE